MKFIRTPRRPALKWIPENEWPDVCRSRSLTIQDHPQESLIGLAYNNENQVVQVTRNVHKLDFIYYVTLLENPQTTKSLISSRSHMTIEYTKTYHCNHKEVATFTLLDVHVRKEGLGERNLLLEALINDVQKRHLYYRISGDFEIVTHHGQVSTDCFTRYGFQLHQNALILQNFNAELFVT
ncbi:MULTISPECIES: hypothetical protein [unclassified Exiguobacterium]|uniref:hypothetical protein n=1 Tax=unclassified Exiguobacterium TaxID=2644629 RepID=UPI000B596C55|nr:MULTISPECIES: hypothetical protein [unclassified Exiguobacterium]ASI35264.1 hypothetical protein A0126_06685 [Exiguobacterium sp. N4-1P]ASI37277.1 hypothetical protein A0126_16960 [Exiguobacterium sp. N4-1P]